MSDSISTLFASNTHTASRRSQLTKLLAARMIQGYVVLHQKCAWCDVPLVEFRGSVSCVVCTESPPQQQHQQQERELGEGEKQEEVIRGVERSDVSTKTNATEDSIEIMLHDKDVPKEQKNSKNALFMAAIAGLAKEARRKLLEEDERQEAGNTRREEQAIQREKTEEVTLSKDLKDDKMMPPPPPYQPGTLAPSALNPPTSPVNHSLEMEAPHGTSTKGESEPTVDSGASHGIEVTPLPPLSPPMNDIPEIKSSFYQHNPVSSNPSHLAAKTNVVSSPQLPRAATRYPSPNLTTRKMMTINNLTKEPQSLKAPSYREKAYILPSRDRRKSSMSTEKICDDISRVDHKEEKEKAQEESPSEQKVTQPTDSNPYDNGFFQELKHRAALQNATHALWNAEQAVPKDSKRERLDSVVFQSCHDEISALGSQSSYESDVPSKASVVKRNSSEKATLPMEATSKSLIAPSSERQTLDVLPDDEKKDIAMECMKVFKAPLPFDEGSAKSGLMDEDVAVTSDVDDYKSIRSTPTIRSTNVGGASTSERTSEEAVDHGLVEEEMDGYHSVQNSGWDENETLSCGSTKQENTAQSEEEDRDDSVISRASAKVETTQSDDHSLEATTTVAKIDEVKPSVEVAGITSDTLEVDTESSILSQPTVERSHQAATEISSTVKVAESSSDPVQVQDNGPNLEEKDIGSLRQSPLGVECSNEVVANMNSAGDAAKDTLNDIDSSHMCMAGKSLRSHKSSLKYFGGANFDEERSLKSMPAVSSQGSIRRDFREELEEFKSKMRVAALIQSKEKQVFARNTSRDVTQSTVEQREATETSEQQEEEGTCLISIKEIKVSGSRGDAPTALASISSKMEDQTRRLAQLEAEALRKHKEAEKAATKAREALEKMLEARSTPKEAKVASTGEHVELADLSRCSTKGSRLESMKNTPKPNESINAREKECPSLTSQSKYSSKHSCEKTADARRTQEEAKCELLDGRDDRADLSLCSTLSEDSGLKFDKAGPTRDVKSKEYEKDYTSVASRSRQISVAGSAVPDQLSFARKQGEAKNALPDRNVKQAILSESPRMSTRPKKHMTSLRNSYSDASFSQYSNSYAESSCRSSESGSTRELGSVSSNGSSTHESSIEGRHHEVRKHHNIPHRTLERTRSSSKGRFRDQSPLSTQRSKSSSPVEVTTRKKSLQLPSLMSPDPPSKPRHRSRPVANDRSNGRSHSLPRNKSSRSKSKDSGKISAKTDLLMSKSNSSRKPNHLLHYSSRRGSNVNTDTKASVPSGISPEVRQPIIARSASTAPKQSDFSFSGKNPDSRQPSFSSEVRQPIIARSTSTPQKQSDFLFSGKNPDSRQPSFSSHGSAPVSLANYTNRDGASSAGPQIGMPNPENRFLPQEQVPNTQHHMSARHVLGPMPRPTYAVREETTSFPDSQFDTFRQRTIVTGIPATQLGGSSFHQYVPGQSLTPKSVNEHEHFGFKSASIGPYPMSRNVDSIALASHTTFGERMSRARTHHHPVMNFSETMGMRTPLMMSSGTVRAPYSSGQAEYIREEGTHYIKPDEHQVETVGMHTPLMMSSGTVRPPYSSGHAEYLREEGMHYAKPQEHKVRFVDPYISGPDIGVDMSSGNHHYSMPYGRHTGY